MTDDAILSREAAYIYRHAIGFEPIGGDLTKWRGVVQDSMGKSGEMRVDIPNNFPYSAPVLTLHGTTQHPIISEDGKIVTRSISRWKTDYHIFSVIREARQAIASAPFSTLQKTETNQERQALNNQIQRLRAQLNSKKEELSSIKTQSSSQVASEQNVEDMVEDALIDLENEAFALEDAYDDLELKAIDFAKQFVEVRKRYYTIKVKE